MIWEEVYLESVWLVKRRVTLDLCMGKDSLNAIDEQINTIFPYLSYEAIRGFTFDI